MNQSSAKLIRKFINPSDPTSRKVYRRMKKHYNSLTAAGKAKMKSEIRILRK